MINVLIYLQQRRLGTPRYVAEQRRGSRLVWWESPTGKEVDLRQVTARNVPNKVRRQIIKARHRTTQHLKRA